MYTAFSLAMIVAPFFVGMIADRYFAAQKVLGVLNLIGAGMLYYLTQVQDANTFFWVMLGYCLSFAPCIALTNSISMQQMSNPEKDFPVIRVMGTVAWIVVTNIVAVSYTHLDVYKRQFGYLASSKRQENSYFGPDPG